MGSFCFVGFFYGGLHDIMFIWQWPRPSGDGEVSDAQEEGGNCRADILEEMRGEWGPEHTHTSLQVRPSYFIQN